MLQKSIIHKCHVSMKCNRIFRNRLHGLILLLNIISKH